MVHICLHIQFYFILSLFLSYRELGFFGNLHLTVVSSQTSIAQYRTTKSYKNLHFSNLISLGKGLNLFPYIFYFNVILPFFNVFFFQISLLSGNISTTRLEFDSNVYFHYKTSRIVSDTVKRSSFFTKFCIHKKPF